ncbi:DUF1289 domain-containing protein [Proteobacteria bacterium 005FR1]|nr:DUF1289 domain-containing protein [Proteobacteria bacterium 005FR1]
MNNSPKSPCISVCALNEDDVCVGCFRSGQEISRWGNLSADEKKKVLQRAGERRKSTQRFQLK